MGIFLYRYFISLQYLKSHDVKIFKFQILEVLENEGLRNTKDVRHFETSLDAKKRPWICKMVKSVTARIKYCGCFL